jgi:Bacterial regulatory proteins, luxR family
MAVVSPERIPDDIGRLSHRGLGVRDFSLGVARVLRRAVDFADVCVMTMDPATLLPTGHVIENGRPEATTPRLAEIETIEPDFNKFTDLARAKLVAQGLSTSEIAARLYFSPYTVQDHLKSIFAKVGVGTRGELVARLFFDHYAPRLASGAPVGSDGWFR